MSRPAHVLSLSIVLVLALAAMAGTASVRVFGQGTSEIDAAEMAAVQKIRARIEERAKAAASSKPAPYKVTIPNSTIGYEMVPVPAGQFVMGSSAPAAKPDEQPPHKVKVDAFWMQAHEMTWDAYLLFMFADQAGERDKPDALVDALTRPTAPHLEMSFGRGTTGLPAISMTQHAANKFAQWLSAKTGEFYRLPTEAEWEYACRAGAADGKPPAPLEEYAWFKKNSGTDSFTGGTYHKVATRKPNPWGLYDMLGNVVEWTLDQYAPYAPEAAENPWVKPTKPYPLVVRGGSWNDDETMVRCEARMKSDPSWKKSDPQLPKSVWYMTDAQWLGFRLVRPATLPNAEDMYRAWNNGVAVDPY